MVFDSRGFGQAGEVLSEDRFKETRLDVRFCRQTCYACGKTAIYKYRVQQLRRRAEMEKSEDLRSDEDQQRLWQAVPRYAEIPETVKCKSCGEVLGLYTRCIW